MADEQTPDAPADPPADAGPDDKGPEPEGDGG